MHSNIKKGFLIGCLALGSLFLSIINTEQTNLETNKNNAIFQTYATAQVRSAIYESFL